EVRGSAWEDADGDGVRDDGEAGLPGVTLFFDLDKDGRLGPAEPSATTDPSGAYSFVGLAPGDYRVLGLPLAGVRQTVPGPEGYAGPVGPGETVTGIDFGFQRRQQPDLLGLSFAVAEEVALWGDALTVRYAVQNRGTADAGAFAIDFRLSPDA